jgi:hypothetical protein
MNSRFFALLVAVSLLIIPVSNTFAAGWGPQWVEPGKLWGSSECSTAYPKIKFVTYMDAGQAYVSIQKKTGTSWTTVKGPELLDVPDLQTHLLAITVSASSSSTEYRVLVKGGRERAHVTKVTCQGVK